MELLAQREGYDWCGIYILEGDTLVLDAYVGAETEHTRIPVGVGVCGSAVAESRNKLIRDVREEENYLACSVQTRSELVVLIRGAGGVILGQIDIDGHKIGQFSSADEYDLMSLANLLADSWEE